jgi:hypothetical protein
VAFNALAFVVLALADAIGRGDSEIARQLDVSEEANIATWFATFLLLLAAGVLVTAALVARAREDPDTRSWWLLAGGFIYLSVDEAAGLHELLIDPVGDVTDASGLLHYAWIIVAIPAIAIVCLLLLGFLRRLPAATRRSFLVAGAIYVGGTVGVEALEGLVLHTALAAHGAQRVMVTMEELLESLGIALFVGAVLRHLTSLGVHVLSVELEDPRIGTKAVVAPSVMRVTNPTSRSPRTAARPGRHP